MYSLLVDSRYNWLTVVVLLIPRLLRQIEDDEQPRNFGSDWNISSCTNSRPTWQHDSDWSLPSSSSPAASSHSSSSWSSTTLSMQAVVVRRHGWRTHTDSKWLGHWRLSRPLLLQWYCNRPRYRWQQLPTKVTRHRLLYRRLNMMIFIRQVFKLDLSVFDPNFVHDSSHSLCDNTIWQNNNTFDKLMISRFNYYNIFKTTRPIRSLLSQTQCNVH